MQMSSARPGYRSSFYPIAGLVLGLLCCLTPPVAADAGNRYHVTNLVSDIPGMAPTIDPLLINPWGISFSPGSPFWVANQGSGTSTIYTGSGGKVPFFVTIPTPGFAGHSNPTGTVFNGTADFQVAPGRPAFFLFVTLEGTLSGWNPGANPTQSVIKYYNPN